MIKDNLKTVLRLYKEGKIEENEVINLIIGLTRGEDYLCSYPYSHPYPYYQSFTAKDEKR